MSIIPFDEYLNRADTYARSGDWEHAYSELIEAEKLNPNHAGTLTGIGTCLVQMKRFAEAIPYLQKVTGLEPGSVDAHNNLGVAYALGNQYQLAEKAYLSALEISSDYGPAWKNLAFAYLQQNDRIAEGVQILAALVQANPEDVEALVMLAECYELAGNLESASLLYLQILKVQPENPIAKTGVQRVALKKSETDRIVRPEHAQKLAALKNFRNNLTN